MSANARKSVHVCLFVLVAASQSALDSVQRAALGAHGVKSLETTALVVATDANP